MKLALYKGTSKISKAIKFLTRSEYSHAAFLFDGVTSEAAFELRRTGELPLDLRYTDIRAVVEAWNDPSAVRNTQSLSVGHDPRTEVDVFALKAPLTVEKEMELLLWIAGEVGFPYDWKGVFRFVTRRPGNLDKAWFCSELCFEGLRAMGVELFERTAAWEVAPGLIPRSPLLNFEQTYITV